MHRSAIIAITFAAVAAAALALESANGTRFRDRPQVDAAKYIRLITADSLQQHVGFLASDALAGRYVGTNGLEQAARYIIDEYRAMGAAPVAEYADYRQRFTVYQEAPVVVRFTLSVGSDTLFGTQFATDSPADAFPISMNVRSGSFGVAFAGFGIDDDTLDYSDYRPLGNDRVSLTGKWVLVFDGEPARDGDESLLWPAGTDPTGWSTRQFYEKRGAAMRFGGAEGLLIISDMRSDATPIQEQSVEQADVWAHAPSPMMFDEEPTPISLPRLVRVSTRFADALLGVAGTSAARLHRDIVETGRPASFLLPDVRLNMEVRRTRPSLHADNIIAVVEGSDLRDEYVIVTSHYDHNGSNPSLAGDTVYNGAADDASGVAGSLEIARAFAKAKTEGDGPRRTVMFLNTSAEERGVLGSSYFTDHDPAVPLESIRANVNLDGIGGFDAQHPGVPYVYAIESHVLGGELTELVKGIQESHGIEIEIDTSEDFNSDHRSFASYLIPYMYFSTGYTEHYHKPSDEPETIDYDHVTAIARLAFGTIWHLANDDVPVQTNRAHLRSTVGFQCPPCAVSPHDDRVHDEPGYCPTCGMRLVPVRKN